MKIELHPAVTLTGAALLALSLSANWAFFILHRAPAPEAPRSIAAPAKAAPSRAGNIRFLSYRNAVELTPGTKVSPEELKKAVKITPELPFKVNDWGSGSTYSIQADWAPESFYQVKVELPADADGTLREPLEVSFVTGQSDPLIAFATAGVFYPLNGELWELPLQIRNIDKINASLDLMYSNNIADWRYGSDKTRPVGKAEFTVKPARNKIEPWTLPLQSLLPERKPGLYVLTLSSPDGSCYNNQLLVVTDLGISAAVSGSRVLAAVRNLTDGKPVADAELTLISRKNQPLAQGYTDKQGLATLEFSLADDPDDEPRLLLVSKGDDRTFLDCFAPDSRLKPGACDAETTGSPEPVPAQAMRTLFFSERGIMRPGETMHCFVQLRDKETLALPDPQPLQIVLRDPDGRIVERVIATTDAYGTAEAAFTLPRDAVTGYYEAQLGLPGAPESTAPWDSCSFLVTQFVPDQIKVALEATPKDAGLDTPLEVAGSARYYFDEPVRDREVTLWAEYAYEPFAPAAYQDYRFGPADVPAAPQRQRSTTATDPEGRFAGPIVIPTLPAGTPAANMPLKIHTTASVTGANGRTVSGAADAFRHANPWYLGVRRIGDRAQFEWVAIRPDGGAAAVNGPLRYELLERRWNYVTKEIEQSWKRVWTEELVPAGEDEIAVQTASQGSFEAKIDNPGDYRLRVTDPATGICGEVDFYYRYGDGGGIRAANPSVLTFTTDRESYLPGAAAEVKFTLSSPGLVLAASGASKAEQFQTANGKAGENTLTIPIPADFTGGTWYTGVTVLVHDPTRAKEPQRLFGLACLSVDQSRHRLAVTLDTPTASQPNQTETIVVTLQDSTGAPVRGKVQLWAVDAGILALTDWCEPDAFARFYGPRVSAMAFYDTYSQLYPALRILPDGRIGGDGMARRRSDGFAVDPEAGAVVVLPAVETDAAGRVEVPITWPNHTGAMRLMATATGEAGTGSAAREITLRYPASVRVTVPAAVAPQDEFEATLEIFNHEFETLQAQWQLKNVGDVNLVGDGASGDIKLAKGDRAVIKRRFRAGNHPGAAGMVAQLATADGRHWDDRAGFAIRPMSTYGTRTASYVVAPGATRTIPCNPDDWFAGSLTRQIEIGGSPAARLNGCLDWLNSYPYGCAEQTAATAFPFLGIPALVKNGLLPEHFLTQRDRTVKEAIRRLQGMRNGCGTFGMWPGGDGEWTDLTLFATHFLMEAESSGYPVDADWRRELQQNLSRTAADKDNTPRQRAYAVYVAALAGKPLPGIAEELLASAGDDDLTGFLAAAGLMKSGRAKAGAEQLDRMLVQQAWRSNAAEPGWYTPAMRLGLMLWITMDLVPEHPAVHTMAQELAATLDTDRGSTQDNAWAALGLERWSAVYGAAEGAGKITLADGTVREFAGKEPFASDLPMAAVTVTNTGTGNLYVDEFTRGTPVRPIPCADGLTVTRRYLNEAGGEATEAKAGELLTVEVTLQSAGAVDSIVLTDLLPGGVAIEDERLATRYAPINGSQRDKNSPLRIRLLEKGADRLLLFGDLTDGAPAVFTYRVRAVAQGSYRLPPIEAEAMYQPQIRACTVFDGKTLTVR